jgi:alpha-N-arabinofuranosidase
MADALFSACFLNACLRHANVVDIACFSPVTNTRGPIFVHPEGILKRTTYHTFYMYANYLEDYVVPVVGRYNALRVGDRSTNVLDVVLTSNEAGTRYVYAIVNKDPKESVNLQLDFAAIGKKAPKQLVGKVLNGNSPDDYNDIGAEDRVVPHDVNFKLAGSTVTLPPHSLVFLTLE